VYLGALWNGFALDDVYIIALNPLVQSIQGVWRAFAAPYWPPELGGAMYRPIPVATFALDWLTRSAAWLHGANLLWHAGASVLVAALGLRWAGERAGLAAGLIFAVHPVHVEAVANIVGRAELMAALFALVAVWAALERRVVWSLAAFAVALLCKENGAVAPALIVLAWLAGLGRPERKTVQPLLVGWVLIGVSYGLARWMAIHSFSHLQALASQFVGESPVTVRLTAVAALADVARLLVFPATLRVDYSVAERTAVYTPLDSRFVVGLLILVLWAVLVYRSWRGARAVEAFGLACMGVAYLPVANLLFPTGVLVAERTLYLPSVGLALALGAWLGRPVEGLPRAAWATILAALVLAGGVRSALRVPVWKDDMSVTGSILRDSQRSYRGHSRAGSLLQSSGRPREALRALTNATRIYQRDANVYIGAADAAFTIGRPQLADSLLARADSLCFRCTGLYRYQAAAALARGDTKTADSLLARAGFWESH
jgi:hypothetical protein